MPLNAAGWTTEEDERLAELVKAYPNIYDVQDPAKNDVPTRESTWQNIGQTLQKPADECKKRWRGLRDGYMRSRRVGSLHKNKIGVFEKLQYLDKAEVILVQPDVLEEEMSLENDTQHSEEILPTEQQVITDNQEYYEITVVEDPDEKKMPPVIKLLPQGDVPSEEPPKKVGRKNCGRRKAVPVPKNLAPVKILPKPALINSPKLVRYIEDSKTPEQRSQTIDKLIERVLKENTNEIDVFFKSMAASVKKLQPHLIPKVKMEVCNVIAKYEMLSFDRGVQN